MKKYTKYRGGYIPSRPSILVKTGRSTMPTISKQLLSDYANKALIKYGPVVAEYGKNYLKGKLAEFTSVRDGNVVAGVPGGLKSVKKVVAPTVYSQYGSISRTSYTEGKSKLPSYIKRETKLQQFTYQTVSMLVNSGAQGALSNVVMSGGQMKTLTDNLILANTAIVNGQLSTQCFFHKADVETRFSNSANSGAVLDVYEVVPRRDLDGNNTQNNPINSWNTGLAQQTPFNGMSLNTMSAGTYFSSPFDSQVFTSLWLVKKKFSIELPAGAAHVHKATYFVNKNIDRAILNATDFGNANAGYVGFTKCIMYVLRGTPGFVSGTPSTVSTAVSGVDVVLSAKISAYAIPDSNRITGFNSGLVSQTTSQYVPAVSKVTNSNV